MTLLSFIENINSIKNVITKIDWLKYIKLKLVVFLDTRLTTEPASKKVNGIDAMNIFMYFFILLKTTI